jgi:catechol 2,3-dioxygenase-like lactoylglutathione lyase family enzyme
MQRVLPTLRILDSEKSKAFYVEKLGFHVDWEWHHAPESPVFMQISRDGLASVLPREA